MVSLRTILGFRIVLHTYFCWFGDFSRGAHSCPEAWTLWAHTQTLTWAMDQQSCESFEFVLVHLSARRYENVGLPIQKLDLRLCHGGMMCRKFQLRGLFLC